MLATLFMGEGLYWRLFLWGMGLYWRPFYEELLFYMKMALLTKNLLNETVAR